MKKKYLITAACVSALCLSLAACRAPDGEYMGSGEGGLYYPNGGFIYDYTTDSSVGGNNYQYGSVTESPFETVGDDNASSYFSLDRNTAGYSYARAQINRGYQISPSSVRVEELINYFDYSYPQPEDGAVGVWTNLYPCPWNEENVLLTVGVTTEYLSLDAGNGNYVFLVDVSGSMSGDDRLGLAKYGFNTLVDNLGGGDIVSIVKYASGMEVVADGIECTESGKAQAKNAMNGLRAYGSTNGAGGLELAYQTAEEHFITGGNNRVIIISDGDFNVGRSSTDEMKEFIQEKAKGGTYLSVIGVGMGNTRDDMLETLATCGNGNYAYLDNQTEAQKVFTHDLSGTLKTVAKDAKAGVTFSENVEKYRLIGYDTKHLSEEDFNDSKTDAGEIGSGLCATAIYELTLKSGAEGDIADVEIKYKDVQNDSADCSVKTTVTTSFEYSTDADFASCVTEFGLILRQSEFKAQAALSSVAARLEALSEYIADDPYKQEFVTLVNKAIQSEKYE
ncbi:MAG: von Willebrand factor type A domain-containing protein [Clostridiales bacterium]|nr:von Willebrand factor type A domain-containing protein [Clostridiales bacterium]